MSDILASPGRQQIKSTASSPLAGTKTLVSTSVGTGGILKLNKCAGASTRGRRVHFDALALLLDAAYGGDMSLVVASAAQMPDVSRSNDEGITALHNAVCAGHFDIVQFLVGGICFCL
jgi:apoptosis-stimulating of p53 protein 1